ncbi:MAG: glycosyltransferase, partial [Bacteroidetes bacterium]|nr:glycosyltransferase [Bacteroidota bacterium]
MTYIFVNQATRYLFIDIINCFANNGCKVELYAGEIREGGEKVNDTIIKHIFTRYDNSTPFKRLLTFLLFTSQVFFKLLFRKKHNIRVILVTTPPFLPFIGIFFNKLFRVPFDLIVYDLYPDVFINFGIVKKKSWLVQYWDRLNVSLYKRATKVFTISNYMAERLKEQGCSSEKLITVSNWVDASYIKPIEKSQNIFIKEHCLEDKFVVLYSGNMGATHDLETLITVAIDL